jgi:hypothetical protein
MSHRPIPLPAIRFPAVGADRSPTRGTDMDDYPTCGEGLAENAALPAKLGELTTSVAGILEAHMSALDLTDERSKREYEAYRILADDHRRAGLQLKAIGEQMAGYRDLPMGRHDTRAMASSAVAESFRRFVELELELLALLQGRVEQDRQMLAAMGVGG